MDCCCRAALCSTHYVFLCPPKKRDQLTEIVTCHCPNYCEITQSYFKKEISLVFSRGFGPGYDKIFEDKEVDYPFGYVRWTARRNMEEFLELIKEGKVNVDKIITHRFNVNEALEAYEMIRTNKEKFLGVLFKYEEK